MASGMVVVETFKPDYSIGLAQLSLSEEQVQQARWPSGFGGSLVQRGASIIATKIQGRCGVDHGRRCLIMYLTILMGQIQLGLTGLTGVFSGF
ncbi:hypothetical protein PDE_09638 [Penicillium oxalicum 114-2]|uniref:Uncharacterized protein n=1 Tax=Penicillium oxalicum (strain 114-2 / CGMCC 5302) TaxID=933388 RepID=S7ZW56_PENO1|nr:hypothetical protein PDE_09638 [Penicillium oxalicum 114-2]